MARIVGTNGNDSLVGTSSADTIEGLAGHDTLVGLAGNDTLLGGTGDDRYVVGSGDVLSDSGGTDTVESTVSWTLGADFENLIFTGTGVTSGTGNDSDNLMIGNNAGNWMRGRGGNDTLIGGGGNDTFNMRVDSSGRYGDDSIDGGSGVDTLDFGASAWSEVVIDLGAGTARGGGDSGNGPIGTVTLVSVENANGSAYDDRMTGSSAANFLFGYNGNDTIDGAEGADRLEGGLGNDHYVFSAMPGTANADTVVGFVSGTDKIVLANLDLGPNGNFGTNDHRFASGSGVSSGRDADDRVVYNTTTGQLFYDGDGNGSGAALLVATLSGAPTLRATDIVAENSTSSGGRVNGTEGDDTLIGTPSDDTIDGRGGNDLIMGQEGADSLIGGTGNDTLQAGHNNSFSDDAIDTLDGGSGDDVYFVSGEESGDNDDVILADPGGTDVVVARTSWTLGAGLENLDLDDYLGTPIDGTGNELNNIIRSGSEGGTLRGMGGDDLLIARQVQNTTFLFGGDGNDTLQGNRTEEMFGEAGDDVLIADGFSSALSGGAGADQFVFPRAQMDYRITDFASGSDKIRLDAATMSALGRTGNFAPDDERFHAGAAAAETDDRVIWNAATGELWYDADGSGSGLAELIATITGNVVAMDIVVDNGTVQGSVINGTPGNDSLVGTPGDDTINGFGGHDTLEGSEGADSLVGGDGNDRLDAGQTTNAGDGAVDTLSGGLGDDAYFVSSDGDLIVSDPGGIDTVHARNTDWTLGSGLENLILEDQVGSAFNGTGNELNNQITSAWEGGTLFGMAGDDLLILRNVQNFSAGHGGDGNDTIRGGRSTELFGDAGNDVLVHGDAGADMTGGSGSDRFTFEESGSFTRIHDFASGTDEIVLDATSMSALGASGNFAPNDERFHAGFTAAEADDRVIWNASTGQLWYDADGSGSGAAQEIATLQAGAVVVASDIEVIKGSTPPPSGGQTINGTSAPDTLTGGAGNDSISGGAGSDRLFGLDGNDTLVGGTEADNMFGDNGNDWLDGDAGQDRLTGGAGADSFVFNDALASANADYVNDFASGSDRLLLDDAVFTRLGGPGSFTAGDERFVAAPGARNGVESDDRLMYDTSTGKLYYDEDGLGGKSAYIVGVVTGAPTIVATDITVI